MTKLSVVLLGVIIASVTASHEKNWSVEIEKINNAQNSWTAAENEITAKGLDYMKKLLGTKFSKEKTTLPVKSDYELPEGGIPDTFDARKQWSKCKSISVIRDQGYCGSCWAVAATSSMTDRLCVKSKGKFQGTISAENLMCCCSDCVVSGGCDGGYPEKAWDYFTSSGIVTGGDYGSKQGCQPYEIQPDPATGQENTENVYTPPCYNNQCTNKKYKKSYIKDKHFGQSSYFVDEDVSKIQTEILTYGPVEAAFDVYDDFMFYSGGVYTRQSDDFLGGHAVRVIGWGKDNNVPYWLVANSWGNSWGEKGLFRIRRGTNECGFEEYITAGVIKN